MRRWVGLVPTVCLCLVLVSSQDALAQPAGGSRPPVIDMHVHGGNLSPQAALERMQSMNIRFMLVHILAPELQAWSATLDASSYLPALGFPCPNGNALFSAQACWAGNEEFPDPAWLRDQLQSGTVRALGELVPQFLGASPGDQRMEIYWEMSETLDVPVAIHMGPGPPAAAYESSPAPVKYPEYRMAASNPMLLEEVLLRHKGLRVLIMHAGWPFLESTLALLYAHPNVYLDLGALQAEFMVPRASYYAYLRPLVDAGFARRIVFGSDFAAQTNAGIDAILSADFLTAEQKSDILCNNAARFLRLDAAICAP
jgi:hypothetical protein